MAVLAKETCFCCNSKLGQRKVYRANNLVRLVSAACLFSLKTTDFHIPLHNLFIRQASWVQGSHYSMMQKNKNNNLSLMGGWDLACFICSPGQSLELKRASNHSKGLARSTPFLLEGNHFHSI